MREMQAAMRQQDLKVAELEQKVVQLIQQNAQSESSQRVLLKANECLQIAMAQLQSIIKQQDLKITQLIETSERSPILVQRGTPDQKVKGPVLADSSSPMVHTLPHEPYIPRSLLESATMVRQAKERAREEQYTYLGVSKGVILERMMKRGLLKPLGPRPPQNPLPADYNADAYCNFHQGAGHNTEECRRLGHAIQELINKGFEMPLNPTNQMKKMREK